VAQAVHPRCATETSDEEDDMQEPRDSNISGTTALHDASGRDTYDDVFVKTAAVVLAGVDREVSATTVIDHAVRLAKTMPDAELHVVHAVAPLVLPMGLSDQLATNMTATQLDEARAYVAKMGDYAARVYPGVVRAHLVFAEAADGVLRTAERVEADAVVIGTHDYRGVRRLLLGSVAADISRRALAPVLIVRPLSYPGSRAPAVEPLCPDCASARFASAGDELWCKRHREHHPRAHTYYDYPDRFGVGSQLLSEER